MNYSENQINRLLDNLSRQTPEPDNANELTDAIMSGIKKRKHRSRPPAVFWIRTISGSAAIFLLGLFLIQQNEVRTETVASIPNHWMENRMNIDSLCIQNKKINKKNLIELYYCYLQQNSQKNKQLQSYKQITD